ncbi:unnamed protein product [Phytophthora lilii]|uniref:Unnamed protein product n=1 Tax=Phytophthora lilii TaxID=2077276 RepID=A0A9W6T8G9_9STRA|nr:unnamed protein product [Phytophthora lilii]
MEIVQKNSNADKAAAASASNEVEQVQRIAETKERRLQHELELSEATRQELENQIKSLISQVDEMKEEQRRSEEIYGDQRSLQQDSERLKRDLQVLQQEHEDLKSRFDETSANDSNLQQQIALLTADKTFLQDSKTQLEEQVAKLRSSQQEMQARIKSLQEKHDGSLSQNAQVQNETRLHFEKKLDDEMNKFMELSKREIERIRNNGQVVYERENRLLKEGRDDALKHVEMLQARLDSVQSSLDEKLKEYELLEIDLDGAVIQTGEIVASDADPVDGGIPTNSKLQEVMTTFGAIPTTTKRRVRLSVSFESARNMTFGTNCKPVLMHFQFQQSVLLAQRVVKSQREALALEHQLSEVTSDRTRLEKEVTELKVTLASCHQPQSREQELHSVVQRYQEAQTQLQQLRAQYQQVQDANASLQHQLQQLLSRRGDLDALKATVQLLRGKIQATNQQKQLKPATHQLQRTLDNEFSKVPATTEPVFDPGLTPPIISSFAKVSPPPSIASKMTRPPTPLRQEDDLSFGRPPSEASSSSSVSSTPRWYTKLRAPAQQQQHAQ